MTIKKIWRWIRIILLLIFIISVVIFVSFLGIVMFSTLTNKKALVDTPTVNAIALILGLTSLPGLFVQLISFMSINEKKVFKASTKCPHCKHLVEIKLIEE